ncbi:hypothetical protein ALMP_35740 [Streptomyces sp. A012304]|nr:hypothetical protein ALMP_35740 [Streptomyces sp. A012304]
MAFHGRHERPVGAVDVVPQQGRGLVGHGVRAACHTANVPPATADMTDPGVYGAHRAWDAVPPEVSAAPNGGYL